MNDNYAIFVTLSASEGSQKPKRDFSLRFEMTNTAKMSSRQSGATRDLKKNKQENITTMKRYIKPTSEFIEVETSSILEGSMYVGDQDESVGIDEQLTGEQRGDWQDIWSNM